MSRVACIYGLKDPSDGQIYYVGQTIDFDARIMAHLHCERLPRLKTWIRGLKATGLTPQALILEANPKDGLYQAEKRWIKHYLTKKAPLLNVRQPKTHQQLRFILPFSEEERLRFPLRRLRHAYGISRYDLAWNISDDHATRLRLHLLIEKLEAGFYGVSGENPSRAERQDMHRLSRETGLSVKALLRPWLYLSAYPEYPPAIAGTKPHGWSGVLKAS